jgi:Flp pilus assembly protein TadG
MLRDKFHRRANGLKTGLASESGVAAVEFAFLAPILLVLITGVCQFTMVLGNYMTLEHAVGAGARILAISRGDSTPVTDAQTQIFASAGTLNTSNITISYSVNGTNCASDNACGTALSAGVPAQVTATYPCNLVVMGTNFAPGCTLSVGATERVE